jgi:hypothetical protein
MHTTKFLLLSLALSAPALAQDIKVVGTLEPQYHAPQTLTHGKSADHAIKLLKVELTKPGIEALGARTNTLHSMALKPAAGLPNKIALGMNDVPVLDQGTYGTCVTFAVTAALNAAFNEGDYISQLCQLQLGNYLQGTGYLPSGWDGSLGRFALNQIDSFGVISKDQQTSVGCGGLNSYPQNYSEIPDSVMTPEAFHTLSESIENRGVSWSPILDIYTALGRVDTTKTLTEIKKALNEQDRVTFGVLLLDFDLGMMGAVGTYHATNDSWILTPEIERDIYLRPEFGGHEMVITGYDDDAVAVDDEGRTHQGLLTLRNSWGAQTGDHGDFYMSYDYFRVLVIEAQRIRSMQADGGLSSARA